MRLGFRYSGLSECVTLDVCKIDEAAGTEDFVAPYKTTGGEARTTA
jgi:hypothetical protein